MENTLTLTRPGYDDVILEWAETFHIDAVRYGDGVECQEAGFEYEYNDFAISDEGGMSYPLEDLIAHYDLGLRSTLYTEVVE